MSSTKTLSLSASAAAAAVASSSKTLQANGGAVRAVLVRRRTFVTSAITRSPLRKRILFSSERLSSSSNLPPSLVPSQTRLASTAAAPKPSSSLTQEAEDSLTSSSEEEDKKTPDASLAFSTIAPNIHPDTYKAITVAPFKYTHMSAVQAQILPMLPELAMPYNPDADAETTLKGKETPRDLLVKAKTGTGKTMAFLVPAIEARLNAIKAHIDHLKSTTPAHLALSPGDLARAASTYAKSHPGVLIISPTRELATQIAVEASNLTRWHRGWQVQLLLGGESRTRQMREWRGGRKDVVVATPGRLLDLMESEPEVGEVVARCNMLILDEADTLLDMGFREDIERIAAKLPPAPQRQTFLFSATVSRAIQQIAQATLSPNHKFVNCVSQDDSPVHAHIPQYHTVLKGGEEILPHLLRLVSMDQLERAAAMQGEGQAGGKGQGKAGVKDKPKAGHSKIVVFLSTTSGVQLFSELLRKAKPHLPFGTRTYIYEMHAKRDMKTRTRVSAQFRADTQPSILVTSDVSARGVDYPGVTRVIQVGAPSGRDIYIHRVGRTGRGSNKQGRGDLVLMPWEMGFVQGKLRDVGLRPVTAADTATELEALAERVAGDPNLQRLRYDSTKAAEIPTLSKELTTYLAEFERDDVIAGFSSMIGFFIGKYKELGLDLDSVAKGLQRTWMEMWGLEREPVISKKLMDMMQGGLRDRQGR
ncbi:hypothetical protein CVT26_005606, partial [Gymnopilus dilepis]